jgi:hypothetical protein
MAMRRIFWVFCINWILIYPLHYLSSRFDFGFEFADVALPELSITLSFAQFAAVVNPQPTLKQTQ